MTRRGNKKARNEPELEPEQSIINKSIIEDINDAIQRSKEQTRLPENIIFERQNSREQIFGDNYNFSMPEYSDKMDIDEPEIEVIGTPLSPVNKKQTEQQDRGTRKRRYDDEPRRQSPPTQTRKTARTNTTFTDALNEFKNFGSELVNDINMNVDEKVETYERLINQMIASMGDFKKSCEKFRDKKMNESTVNEFKDTLKQFNDNMIDLLGQIAASDISPASMRKLYNKITPQLIAANNSFKEFVADPKKIDESPLSKSPKKASPVPRQPSRIELIRQMFKTETEILLKMIAATYEKVYAQGPDKCRKVIASISVLLIIYNYLPVSIRRQLKYVPYLGATFRVVDTLHTPLLYSQNVAMVSTGIFYYLKNVGNIDLTDYVILIKQNAHYGLETFIGRTFGFIMNSINPTFLKSIIPIPDRFSIDERNSPPFKSSKGSKESTTSSKASVASISASINGVDQLLEDSEMDAPDPVTETRFILIMNDQNAVGETQHMEAEQALVVWNDTASTVSSMTSLSSQTESEQRVFDFYSWVWKKVFGSPTNSASSTRGGRRRGVRIYKDVPTHKLTRKNKNHKLRKTYKSLHF